MKMNKIILIGLSPNSKAFKAYKEALCRLNNLQKEAAIGLFIGDASLQTSNKGKTFRMKFEWGIASFPYLESVYDLFNNYCISKPHRKERISPKDNTVINYGFQTLAHKHLVFLSDIFMYNPHKSLNLTSLETALSPRGLAYWFMDDKGRLDYNPRTKNRSIVLNTQSFSKTEVEGLTNILRCKFLLETEIRSNKNKWVIVIKNSSYPLFHELIIPYMHKSMYYKLFKL